MSFLTDTKPPKTIFFFSFSVFELFLNENLQNNKALDMIKHLHSNLVQHCQWRRNSCRCPDSNSSCHEADIKDDDDDDDYDDDDDDGCGSDGKGGVDDDDCSGGEGENDNDKDEEFRLGL